MTKFQLRCTLALLALVMVTGACSGTNPPTGPSPVPPSPPQIVSFVSIDRVTPTSGSTLDYNDIGATRHASVDLSWEFDPMLPGRIGVQLMFSVDCISSVAGGSSSGLIPPRATGMATMRPTLTRRVGGAQQINCIIARLVRYDDKFEVLAVIMETRKPWVFHFQ